MQSLARLIFKEKVNGEKIAIGGLLPHEEDSRDFQYKDLGGWFDYKPKNKVLILPMLEVKNQGTNNTCVFHSYAAAREYEEGVQLSPRSTVMYARKNGLLRSNGLSTLREGQKAGVDFGIAEETLIPNHILDWETYSGGLITTQIRDNAAKHKSKSFFIVRGRSEWLKALDEGHPIHTGSDWYSAYNMSGGLKSPWILNWRKGWKVGGHAYTCRGYDLSGPSELFRFRNSFGEGWGDNGDFYIRATDLFKDDLVGYVALDLEGDTLEAFIASHEGKNVKSTSRPSIYHIQYGKRRPYTDALTFYACGGDFTPGTKSFEDVADKVLDLIPEGEPMKAEDSIFWPKLSSEWESLKWADQSYAMWRIQQIIKNV